MTLREQIISDMTASMKAQDAPRTSTLRMVKAAMQNRQIEKGGELDDDEMASCCVFGQTTARFGRAI